MSRTEAARLQTGAHRESQRAPSRSAHPGYLLPSVWQQPSLVLPTSSADSEADRVRCRAVPRLWSDCRRFVRLLASPGTSRPRRVLRPPPVNENEMTRWSLLVHPEATIASLLQPQLAAHIAS